MKVVHVITSLQQGGAQNILLHLIKNSTDVEHLVISLKPHSFFSQILLDADIKVYHCNITNLASTPLGVKRLFYIIKKFSPDVVQTWMYHADLLGGLTAKILNVNNIVWGLHHTDYKLRFHNIPSILLKYTCALFSYVVPNKIICCALSTLISHKNSFYCGRKLVCIPNGYDHKSFYPDQLARHTFRKTLSLSDNCLVLGYPARFHELKDHKTLFKALNILDKRNCNFKLLLAGKNINRNNTKLVQLINRFNLTDSIMLLDTVIEMNSFYNSLDVLVSSSTGEACPNILSEAMLCAKQCVYTTVGDSNMIALPLLKNINLPGNYKGLAASIFNLYKMNQFEPLDSIRFRTHIMNNYSLDAMIESYNDVWALVYA